MQSEQNVAPRSSGSKSCSESNSCGPALTVGTQRDNEKQDPEFGTQFSMEMGHRGEKVADLVPHSGVAGLPSYSSSH